MCFLTNEYFEQQLIKLISDSEDLHCHKNIANTCCSLFLSRIPEKNESLFAERYYTAQLFSISIII